MGIENDGYSQEDLAHFKQLLLLKKEALLKELGYLTESSLKTSFAEYSGNNSTYSFHMADHGTDSQEREKAFLFAHREKRYLDHLEMALKRIEDGTYGKCIDCGKQVSRARLEAVPHARLCIECKSNEEYSK